MGWRLVSLPSLLGGCAGQFCLASVGEPDPLSGAGKVLGFCAGAAALGEERQRWNQTCPALLMPDNTTTLRR